MISLPTFRNSAPGWHALAGLVLTATAALLGSCGEDRPARPPSLDSPRDIATATRSECGEASTALQNFNDANDRCTIGLVANADSNRLAISDFGRTNPSLIDLDPSIPSATHISVGENPVDVEASPDGTAAYTLNSIENNLTVLDLWTLEVLPTTLSLPGPARSIATVPGPEPGGLLVAALDEPPRLWIRPGVHCNPPDADEAGCSPLEADATSIALPGRASELTVGPSGGRVYVVYQNRNYMSVFAVDDGNSLGDRGLSCRGNRSSTPCEVRRVGLTYGCSDGVDNDGDGAVDQAEPQCWGPKGAESPDGAGRSPKSACNDGIDNDADGRADRDDSDCQSASDDSERELLAPDASFPCSNDADDDGDGDTDYPEDDSCYGPRGRTEESLQSTGFESVAVDGMGALVYVVDRARSQVLIVDADRLELIDAPAASEPSAAPFTDRLGVAVGRRPAAGAGLVSRRVLWVDPDDSSHGIVRYSFGAYVASDDGNAYFVEAVTSECEVREPDREELLTSREFRIDSSAFRNSMERSCLTFPEFPLDKETSAGSPVDACEQRDTCLSCIESGTLEDCRAKCDDFTENDLNCRAAGRELEPSMQTRLVVNPTFGLRDTRSTTGRLAGRGECTAPEIYEDRLRTFADAVPDAPRTFDCDSPLRPQPLTPLTTDSELASTSFESLPRARLLHEVSAQLRPPSEERDSVTVGVSSRPFDFRFRDESWTVTWEGVLPDASRDDGLLARETREVERGGETRTVVDLDPGGANLCSAGVRAGDRIIIKSEPKTGDDAPDVCSKLTLDDSERGDGENVPDNLDPFRTYRIASVRPDTALLEPISNPEKGQQYAQTLPTRKCFPSGLKFDIRAEDEWVVRGGSSGFVSERTSELGRCVERFDDGTRRLGGRVEDDGLFLGPYMSFFLYDGYEETSETDVSLSPLRRPGAEFQYRFSVQRFFKSDRLRPSTILPSDVHLVRNANRGRKLLVADANEDFVWLFNFGKRKNRALRLR